MMENYITLSLETHLFFSRIMKEHAFFLGAGFPCKNEDWIQKADSFRQQFEQLLADVIKISNGRVNSPILESDELVTEFTINAEKRTECLSGVPFNTELSRMEHSLRSGSCRENSREILRMVHQINERSICLLNGLIDFKENILREVGNGRLFTFNYPLLIEHILREARLYRHSFNLTILVCLNGTLAIHGLTQCIYNTAQHGITNGYLYYSARGLYNITLVDIFLTT